MVSTKRSLSIKLSEKIIFAYLAIFPLGQIIRFDLKFLGNQITIHPTDVVIGVGFLVFLLSKLKYPKIYRYISAFISASVFSLLFSLTIFKSLDVFVGVLYLLRMISYSTIIASVWYIAKDKSSKSTLFNSLIAVSIITAIFGWIQYFWIPDLTDLKYIGWDDHLFRLVGTFLDPAFTGIIVVLGFLATITKFLYSKDKNLIVILILLALTIAFTYSRASYVALFAGVFTIALIRKYKNLIVWSAIIFLILIPLLPRPAGEGVRLERLSSVFSRFEDYKGTMAIFKKQPVFGVGFNNLCAARLKYLGEGVLSSHACSGSDSSLLFVAATTGVVGLLIFLYMSYHVIRSTSDSVYGDTLKSSAAALFVNSLFVNSLFYPWVMGWMAILIAISVNPRLEGKVKG